QLIAAVGSRYRRGCPILHTHGSSRNRLSRRGVAHRTGNRRGGRAELGQAYNAGIVHAVNQRAGQRRTGVSGGVHTRRNRTGGETGQRELARGVGGGRASRGRYRSAADRLAGSGVGHLPLQTGRGGRRSLRIQAGGEQRHSIGRQDRRGGDGAVTRLADIDRDGAGRQSNQLEAALGIGHGGAGGGAGQRNGGARQGRAGVA